MFAFGLPLLNDNLKPIKFHPYTSRVHNRILEVECIGNNEELTRAYRDLEKELIRMFTAAGIKAWPDNKIVFELDNNGTRLFYGFYDWRFSIGLGYHDENEPRRTPEQKFDRCFCYPDFVRKNIVYAEEVEEAIIQYLVRQGYHSEDKLRNSVWEFEELETGRFTTCQVLKVKWS